MCAWKTRFFGLDEPKRKLAQPSTVGPAWQSRAKRLLTFAHITRDSTAPITVEATETALVIWHSTTMSDPEVLDLTVDEETGARGQARGARAVAEGSAPRPRGGTVRRRGARVGVSSVMDYSRG